MDSASPAPKASRPLGRVLVTGGCGFLGSHIVRLLLERYPSPDTTVAVLDLRTSQNRHEGAEYFAADLTDASALRQVLEQVKPNVVIHTASPVFRGGDNAQARVFYRKVNVEGTRLVMEESRKSGTKAFVHTSSASVITDCRSDIINADETWGLVTGKKQNEIYSDTKAEAEKLVLSSNARSPTTTPFLTVAVRPSSMFGEADVQHVAVHIQAYHARRTGFQIGNNNNLFDYVYVGNVAHAHLLAADLLLQTAQNLATGAMTAEPVAVEPADHDGRVDGEAFIITNQTPVYFWDMPHAIWHEYAKLSPEPGAHVPRSKPIVIHPAVAVVIAAALEWVMWLLRLGAPTLTASKVRYLTMTRYFKPAKSQALLGYKPLWTLDEGIGRTVRWFKEKELADKADAAGKKKR